MSYMPKKKSPELLYLRKKEQWYYPILGKIPTLRLSVCEFSYVYLPENRFSNEETF